LALSSFSLLGEKAGMRGIKSALFFLILLSLKEKKRKEKKRKK